MLIQSVSLGDPERIRAWFTGRGNPDGSASGVGMRGNLSHRRPHRPRDLAVDRAFVGSRTGTDPAIWQMMQQVHGTRVAVVDEATPPGYEHRGVDALVTAEPERPLVVQAADCLPVLLAGSRAVAAIHAGRRGVEAGVVAATVETMTRVGEGSGTTEAVIGPGIGGCCYEVPEELRSRLGRIVPPAVASTTWGTPSLDLKAAVTAQLSSAGVEQVTDLGICTGCDERFFSHRRDSAAGRHIGLVVRREGRG